jgi:hypothetical protein
MKFNEIIKDKEYRERVIKYFRLPMRLSVSEEKFLSDLEFLQEVNPKEYNEIVRLVEHDFNKEAKEQNTDSPDFTMEHILEPLIEKFEANDRWQEFLTKDYSDVLDGYEGITNTHGFYKKENDGKHFVSVDLEAANWQSLQTIIGFDKSYEELIVEYTNNLIPPISKTFRTKITGILGAKSIMNFNMKLLIDNKEKILDAVYEETGVDLRDKIPFAFYADEFLLEIDEKTKNDLMKLNLKNIETKVYEDTGVRIHFTPFTLRWLDVEKGCVKLYKDNEYEIINISKDILLIFNKLINNVEIKDIDFEKIKLKNETRSEFINRVKTAIDLIENSLE